MKKERDEKKEREARLLKRQQLKTLSQSLVARRNLGEYMGNEDDTVNGLLRFYYACKGYTNLRLSRSGKMLATPSAREKKPCLYGECPSHRKRKSSALRNRKSRVRKRKQKRTFFLYAISLPKARYTS